jgi:hypothetical protein
LPPYLPRRRSTRLPDRNGRERRDENRGLFPQQRWIDGFQVARTTFQEFKKGGLNFDLGTSSGLFRGRLFFCGPHHHHVLPPLASQGLFWACGSPRKRFKQDRSVRTRSGKKLSFFKISV